MKKYEIQTLIEANRLDQSKLPGTFAKGIDNLKTLTEQFTKEHEVARRIDGKLAAKIKADHPEAIKKVIVKAKTTPKKVVKAKTFAKGIDNLKKMTEQLTKELGDSKYQSKKYKNAIIYKNLHYDVSNHEVIKEIRYGDTDEIFIRIPYYYPTETGKWEKGFAMKKINDPEVAEIFKRAGLPIPTLPKKEVSKKNLTPLTPEYRRRVNREIAEIQQLIKKEMKISADLRRISRIEELEKHIEKLNHMLDNGWEAPQLPTLPKKEVSKKKAEKKEVGKEIKVGDVIKQSNNPEHKTVTEVFKHPDGSIYYMAAPDEKGNTYTYLLNPQDEIISTKKPKTTVRAKTAASELDNCKKILADANYRVSKKKADGKTKTIKTKRQDRTIIKDRVDNTFRTITKGLSDKKPEDQPILKQATALEEVSIKIFQSIDKLVQDRDEAKLKQVLEVLKRLV